MFALPLLALLAAATGPCLAAADVPHVPIFTWGEGGYFGFREPGLLLLPTTQPTLLAFAEAGAIDLADGKLWQRGSGGSGDTGGTGARARPPPPPPPDPFCCDIVSKRSTDGGVTWGPLAVVLANASQPSAVWDTRSSRAIMNADGSIHFGRSGAALQTASADGITWSPRSMLGRFVGNSHPAPLATGLELFTGPHKGRLLFVGWRSYPGGRASDDAIWYTDDSGRTYKLSNTSISPGGEAQLVQNEQGTVIANIRVPASNTLGSEHHARTHHRPSLSVGVRELAA